MSRRELAAALLVAVALRLAFSLYAARRAPLPSSNDGYETLAVSLLTRGEYALEPGAPSAFREPGYPLLIAAVYAACGPRPWAVLLLQALLGAATAWLAGRLAARLFGQAAARLSLWSFAVYPYSIYYSAYFFRETLMTALASALAWLSLDWALPGGRGDRAALGAGACAGWLALCNSAWLPATALAALAAAEVAPRGRRAARMALAAAPLLLACGLWAARNRRALGAWIPGSTHGGEEFYQALTIPPGELGTARQGERLAVDPLYKEIAALPEREKNARFFSAAAGVVAANPALYLRRVAARAVKFWRLWPYPRRYNVPYPLVVLLSLLSDGWIVLGGLAGLIVWRSRWREAAAVPALVFGGMLAFIAVHVVLRYRMPLMGVLTPFACAAALAAARRQPKRLAAAAALALLGTGAADAQGVAAALEAELKRAATELRVEDYPPPYFIALTATDASFWDARCQMGAPNFRSEYMQRVVTPELRVGGYELDNHPVAPSSSFIGRVLPLADDEFALRHELWLLLDDAYKAASADFLRKAAQRVSRGKTEYDTDDLSREPARRRAAEPPADRWPRERLVELCAAGSAVFRRRPDLLDGGAAARIRRHWSRRRESDGTSVDYGREWAELELEAVARSADGMRLFAARRFAAPTPESLPSRERLQAAAAEMLADLSALQAASSTSPFSAPALLDPSVSAAVTLAIALRMTGEEQRNPSGAQTFRDKVGKRVLPRGFRLRDDPTRAEYAGLPLVGHYEFDDEAVAARPVDLVEDGVLKELLLSRYPVVELPRRSNGHGRAAPGYRPAGAPGSLFLNSASPLTTARLLERLREECRRRGKPYGLWIRRLRHFVQQQGTGGHAAIRLMPGLVYLVEAATGELTLVRDLDLVGTPLVLMNNIVAAGDDVEPHNIAFALPASVTVPSLLLSEVELQRAETKPEKAPILAPPHVAPHVPSNTRRQYGGAPAPPTIPQVPHVQVQRYVIRGHGRPGMPFVMEGLLGLRQHLEGDDLVIDAKISAPSLPALAGAIARLDAMIESLAAGKAVERRTLRSAVTRSLYESQYGSGWPD